MPTPTYGVKIVPTADGLRVEQLAKNSAGRYTTNGKSLFVDYDKNRKNYRDSLLSAVETGLLGEITETHLVKEK